jgi:hypothetical protein
MQAIRDDNGGILTLRIRKSAAASSLLLVFVGGDVLAVLLKMSSLSSLVINPVFWAGVLASAFIAARSVAREIWSRDRSEVLAIFRGLSFILA